ncbi:putative F420-dependent oxidoreductase [Antricoccus suffuscus]|uniref:Putative F420-dependent oxidoreductase n=1 Tax=Antricoccus suffuscus TaxID=1629062 RepID=A0A2T0YZH9_9ACTN|nr:LLM class F420-dependent oxidoreductase [Antricoccus suffuscus]PRZ29507.1 putative F420-dependent oxidoreductase [Antricoccus suffuscus]
MVAGLGQYGVWQGESLVTPQLARELERLGFGTVWLGSAHGDLKVVDELLEATTTLKVATGIVNIWNDPADEVAAAYTRVQSRHPGRFLLGIGAGHREAVGAAYVKPYQAVVDYLDALDAAGVPKDARVIAALGPKMVRLSGERSAGAHPYLVTPDHTAQAREILGTGVLLAPEQKVVLQTDPDKAREIGRPRVDRPYLHLRNYVNNLRAFGFDDTDIADGGSDRLIDALVARGDARAITERLNEHLEAGADHVAIQLLTAKGDDPIPGYTALAEELFA